MARPHGGARMHHDYPGRRHHAVYREQLHGTFHAPGAGEAYDGITQRVRVPLAMHQRMPVCALCSAGTAEHVAGPCVPTSLLLVQDGRLLRDPIMHCVSK